MDIYRRIFEESPDGLLVIDERGRIVDTNAQAEALFGYIREDLIGELIETLVPVRSAGAHVRHRERYVAQPHIRRMGAHPLELHARRKDGSEFPTDILISPLQTESGMVVLCAVRDITPHTAAEEQLRLRTVELEKLHENMKVLASRDGLTELLNRRAFQEQVEWLLRNSVRRGESLSLLMIDLDFFKRVNDQFGHAEGDRVLLAVADALRATCRQNDVACRYGGEEFAIALPDTDESGSRVAAENFRTAIAGISGLHSAITASVGAVTYTPADTLPPAAAAFEHLVNDADRALYAAKRAGRNRICHVHDMSSR